MRWKCEARADHLDDEIWKQLKWVERVKIGFESGSNRLIRSQKVRDKRRNVERSRNVKKAGFIFSYFMATRETDDDLKETIDFAKKVDADYYSLSVLAPYYGTELYDQLMKNGHELDQQPWEYFFHQSPKPMVNDKLSTKVLSEYLSLAELNTKNKKKRGYI